MKACACFGSVSILVKGSPTKEFQVAKGIRQGVPLAPFLFLIVAEGLSGLIRMAVDLMKFNGLKVGEMSTISLL